MSGALDLARRRLAAPPASAKIDRQHPLARGLRSYMVNGVDLVSGRPSTGAIGYTAGPYGRARNHQSAAGFAAPGVRPTAANGITYAYVGALATTSGDGYIISLSADSAGTGIYELSGNLRWINGGVALGSVAYALGTSWHSVVGAAGVNATAYKFFVDGVQVYSQSGLGSASSPSHDFAVGAGNGGAAYPMPGVITLGALWDRELSAAECVMQSADPFGLVRRGG